MRVPKSTAKSKKKSASHLQRKRLDPVARRKQLLAAAKVVFAENPDASLEDIAREAGVTRQAVSLHFPGGGTGPIYEAILDEFIDEIPNLLALAAVGSEGPPSTLAERVRSATEAFLEWADGLGVPWLFTSVRDRPGTHVAERWELGRSAMADAILAAQPQFGRSLVVRAAVRSALTGAGDITADVMSGTLSRDDYMRIVELQMVTLIEEILPALTGK